MLICIFEYKLTAQPIFLLASSLYAQLILLGSLIAYFTITSESRIRLIKLFQNQRNLSQNVELFLVAYTTMHFSINHKV